MMLAVTRKVNGICIAGVTNDIKWVRHVKNRILNLEDINPDKGYLAISKVYDFSFVKHAFASPQTENYLIDETKRITRVKALTEDEKLDEEMKKSLGSIGFKANSNNPEGAK